MQCQIFKYIISQGEQIIDMPRGAKLLSIAEQRNNIVLYALVDPTNPIAKRRILVVGTGWGFSVNIEKFIGTVNLVDGELMFHVFDGFEQ